MEENTPKTGKYALNFGLILGAAGLIFGLMLYSMDMHYDRSWPIQVVNYVLMAAVIIIAIAQFKKANTNFLKIGEALKIGAGVALIAGIIGLIYFFVLSNIIEPDYMDKMYELGKVEAMEKNPNLTEAQINQGIEMQKNFAWVFYPIGLIVNIIIGLVFGLIGGLIMQKQKPAY